jgi:large subunit ribosomal protein L11
LKAANLKSGSDNPLKNKVASLTAAQIDEIVEKKIADLNTDDKEMAAKIIAGTCRSMGVDITE